jgi:hypothetical protein
VVCSNLLASGRSAVVLTININGLSAAYAAPFRDPATFPALLDEARRTLEHELAGSWRFGAIVVSSFSAGYGAVRELLRQPDSEACLTDLVLVDSLYAGYVEQDGRRIPDPSQIEPFARFARRAAKGDVGFFLTHTQLVPDGYASTRETADALLKACNLPRQLASGRDASGLELESTATQGRFVVRSYQGTTAQDHMDHLRRLAAVLQRTSLPQRP